MRILVLLALCISFCSASLLVRDKENPCRAYGNGTTYDISDLFDWPVKVSWTGSYDQTFTYWWSCNGNLTIAPYECDAGTSICQRADNYYDCGDVAPALWLGNFNFYNPNEFQWTIIYPSDYLRVSYVNFQVDPNVEKPTIQMLGESPFTQYNFLVTGKCIGQPNGPGGGFCNPKTGLFTNSATTLK
eukprot:TRINITY_DN45_c0_g1_i1.p1 TRINITY_DN45_c0_g1~~TRINITY_DN45_c0_g1_i1.p1  ORF type:complete len:187 (+),score=7.73 TRINITY_DN45_c0_g1_i1:51-611(+)